MRILLSGAPGAGKSTILEKVIMHLSVQNQNVVGCIVKEMKTNEVRHGFEIHYFPSNTVTLLASCDEILSLEYISRFSVNIDAIENELIPFMYQMCSSAANDILTFDEIGRMQNLSPKFMTAVDSLMKAKQSLIATIVYDDEIWARKYKYDADTFFIVVTEQNRECVPTLINAMLLSKHDLAALNAQSLAAVFNVFNTYISQHRFPELLKLFNHTIKYLAHNKANYDAKTNCYYVKGNHGIRRVSSTDAGYSCTCEFHRGYKENSCQTLTGKECSHIQTVSILETCQPMFKRAINFVGEPIVIVPPVISSGGFVEPD